MQLGTFNGNVQQVGEIQGIFPLALIAAETCLFSCDLETAHRHGGALTRQILNQMPDGPDDMYPVIDVRVQRLMPDMFPSIPGWHCDGVPRPKYDAQPVFDDLTGRERHYTCVLSTFAGLSRTQFYNGDGFTQEFAEWEPVWRQLHRRMESDPLLKQYESPTEGSINEFDSLVPHRAVPATTRGWRLFLRLSYYHNPALIENGVKGEQQVYLLSEENGW
jgi:hypothetical protein